MGSSFYGRCLLWPMIPEWLKNGQCIYAVLDLELHFHVYNLYMPYPCIWESKTITHQAAPLSIPKRINPPHLSPWVALMCKMLFQDHFPVSLKLMSTPMYTPFLECKVCLPPMMNDYPHLWYKDASKWATYQCCIIFGTSILWVKSISLLYLCNTSMLHCRY